MKITLSEVKQTTLLNAFHSKVCKKYPKHLHQFEYVRDVDIDPEHLLIVEKRSEDDAGILLMNRVIVNPNQIHPWENVVDLYSGRARGQTEEYINGLDKTPITDYFIDPISPAHEEVIRRYSELNGRDVESIDIHRTNTGSSRSPSCVNMYGVSFIGDDDREPLPTAFYVEFPLDGLDQVVISKGNSIIKETYYIQNLLTKDQLLPRVLGFREQLTKRDITMISEVYRAAAGQSARMMYGGTESNRVVHYSSSPFVLLNLATEDTNHWFDYPNYILSNTNAEFILRVKKWFPESVLQNFWFAYLSTLNSTVSMPPIDFSQDDLDWVVIEAQHRPSANKDEPDQYVFVLESVSDNETAPVSQLRFIV